MSSLVGPYLHLLLVHPSFLSVHKSNVYFIVYYYQFYLIITFNLFGIFVGLKFIETSSMFIQLSSVIDQSCFPVKLQY